MLLFSKVWWAWATHISPVFEAIILMVMDEFILQPSDLDMNYEGEL